MLDDALFAVFYESLDLKAHLGLDFGKSGSLELFFRVLVLEVEGHRYHALA